MSNYSTPGVKVKEVSTFPPSVAQVATAIPAFVGYTELHPTTEPTRISSFAEFESTFGGPISNVVIGVTAGDALDNTYNTDTPINAKALNYVMYYAVQMYFINGGGPCYIVSAAAYPTPTAGLYAAPANTTALSAALAKLKYEDEPTMLLVPDSASLSTANHATMMVEALTQCNALQDRFTVMDVKYASGSTQAVNLDTNFRTPIGTQYLNYGAAYYPYLNASFPYPDTAVTFVHASSGDLNGKTLAEAKRIAAADVADEATAPAVAAVLNGILSDVNDLVTAQTIVLPPSGAVAGVYASVDRDRGVWKAPANVSIAGTTGPALRITDEEQKTMNVDGNGKSINAIRSFTGKGTLVWGARTLAGNDNEWRYVPVRRLYITVEESVRKASQQFVFEPNDANTWTKVKGMIENYLNGLWRQGALAGAKPEDAYFVNVGIGSTMTSQDVLNGILNVEIGMAAVRPAEFIILKFSHKLQES